MFNLNLNCQRCGDVETMEHLCTMRMHEQLELIWVHLGELITQYLNSESKITFQEWSSVSLMSNLTFLIPYFFFIFQTSQPGIPMSSSPKKSSVTLSTDK
jgi:hypothetical protein